MRKEMKQSFDHAMEEITRLNPQLAAGMDITEWNPGGPGEKEWTRYKLESDGYKISNYLHYRDMIGALDVITTLLRTNRYIVSGRR